MRIRSNASVATGNLSSAPPVTMSDGLDLYAFDGPDGIGAPGNINAELKEPEPAPQRAGVGGDGGSDVDADGDSETHGDDSQKGQEDEDEQKEMGRSALESSHSQLRPQIPRPSIQTPHIVVANLTWWTTAEDLKELLEPCGPLLSVKIYDDLRNGKSKGYAVATFSEPAHAAAALESASAPGKTITVHGNPITVNFATDAAIRKMNASRASGLGQSRPVSMPMPGRVTGPVHGPGGVPGPVGGLSPYLPFAPGAGPVGGPMGRGRGGMMNMNMGMGIPNPVGVGGVGIGGRGRGMGPGMGMVPPPNFMMNMNMMGRGQGQGLPNPYASNQGAGQVQGSPPVRGYDRESDRDREGHRHRRRSRSRSRSRDRDSRRRHRSRSRSRDRGRRSRDRDREREREQDRSHDRRRSRERHDRDRDPVESGPDADSEHKKHRSE